MVLGLVAANWAVYVWTAVEMRFGSVLLLVLFPLAGYAALRVQEAANRRFLGAIAFGIAAYVVLALLLSGWVRDQSELIRTDRSAHLNPAPRDATGRLLLRARNEVAERRGDPPSRA